MKRINLLPWRSEKRALLKKQFLLTGGVCLFITCASVGLLHLFLSYKINHQINENNTLKIITQQHESKIKQKKQLLFQIKTLETLDQKRSFDVRLFEEMVQVIPKGVYLSRIDRETSNLTLRGKDSANAYLSHFMQQLEKSKLFSHPNLKETKKDLSDSRFSNSFILLLKQTYHEY